MFKVQYILKLNDYLRQTRQYLQRKTGGHEEIIESLKSIWESDFVSTSLDILKICRNEIDSCSDVNWIDVEKIWLI
jgi:hypothetical protein